MDYIKALLGLVLGVYLTAALIPGALTSLFTAPTTGWSAAAVAIWVIFGVVILAVLLKRIYDTGFD